MQVPWSKGVATKSSPAMVSQGASRGSSVVVGLAWAPGGAIRIIIKLEMKKGMFCIIIVLSSVFCFDNSQKNKKKHVFDITWLSCLKKTNCFPNLFFFQKNCFPF
jgi:hypothetical protein